MGATATLAAGAAGGAAAQQGGGAETVEVDLVNFAFRPGTAATLVVPPGTTVKFVWKTGGHNIHVDSQPDGANWQGHEAIENAGFTASHTFTTPGAYHYWCTPHKSLGMVGDIEVEEGASVGTVEPAEPFQFPGGDDGLSFVGVLLGTVGLAVAIVLGGEAKRTVVPPDVDGPTSARTTALSALLVGVVLLLAIVVRLVLG